MFQNRHIVSAIEFGSSRIRVLIGESGEDGRLEVVGRGEAASEGIVKGEIANMEAAFDQLAIALEDADASSGGELNNSRIIVIPVTGCGIDSYQGVGTVFVKNNEQKVTEDEKREAMNNARVHPLENERNIINCAESFFIVDERLRLRHPINQTAYRLDAHVHVIHGLSNRLENFRSLVRESGYDDNVETVFAPLAAGNGILAEEEHESGVLLVDLGAGVTEFLIEYNNGVMASGMLQVGFNHVLNDLGIGLDLPLESCRKMIEDGTLARLMQERCDYVDFPSATGKVRRIPLASFEIIINQRLREIFEIIRKKIKDPSILGNLNSGAVLTGGGALFPPSSRILREVFDLSVRIGQPLDIGGAATGLENPRYSTVWGALKIANFYSEISDLSGSPVKRLLNGVDGVWNKVRRAVWDFRGSFKV
jgi:cell division protein FtsA